MVRGVYTHWDSYLDHNGRILLNHYDYEKALKLVELGDISSLASDIGEKHDFDSCPGGMTNYYGRDRGEDGTGYRDFDNPDDMVSFYDNEYHYYHDGNKWYVKENSGGWIELETAINELDEVGE